MARRKEGKEGRRYNSPFSRRFCRIPLIEIIPVMSDISALPASSAAAREIAARQGLQPVAQGIAPVHEIVAELKAEVVDEFRVVLRRKWIRATPT